MSRGRCLSFACLSDTGAGGLWREPIGRNKYGRIRLAPKSGHYSPGATQLAPLSVSDSAVFAVVFLHTLTAPAFAAVAFIFVVVELCE